MSEWQPIETAPMDGAVIDLWIIDEENAGDRVTDAYYVRGMQDSFDQYNDDGSRAHIIVRRDGWWAPGFDYDGASGWCDEPSRFYGCGDKRKECFRQATHWMPIPAPPVPA